MTMHANVRFVDAERHGAVLAQPRAVHDVAGPGAILVDVCAVMRAVAVMGTQCAVVEDGVVRAVVVCENAGGTGQESDEGDCELHFVVLWW